MQSRSAYAGDDKEKIRGARAYLERADVVAGVVHRVLHGLKPRGVVFGHLGACVRTARGACGRQVTRLGSTRRLFSSERALIEADTILRSRPKKLHRAVTRGGVGANEGRAVAETNGRFLASLTECP